MEKFEIKVNSLRLTEDEFFAFCQENDHLQIERDAQGNILIMSPTHSVTGNRNFNLYGPFWEWNRKYQKGYLFDSSAGFTLPNGAVRSPDVSFILKERWEAIPQEDKEKFAHLCPDFAVELKSQSDDLLYLQKKMEEYIANGTSFGWLINPYEQQVFVYDKSATNFKLHHFDDPLKGKYFMSNLEINLKEVLG